MIDLRTIPGTEITVSSLGFGTASLHHRARRRDRLDLLAAVAELDIRHLDTAPAYGFGLAEKTVGQFLRGRRGDFTVTTKAGLFPRLGRASTMAGLWWRKLFLKLPGAADQFAKDWALPRIEASLASSLSALQTDYVDFFMLHEPVWPISDEITAWLEDQRQTGKIRAWGIAGKRAAIEPFLHHGHKAARIVQTRDSLEDKQADFVRKASRALQFTYGYFAAGATTVQDALVRNPTGCVLFSTRHVSRVRKMIAG